MDSYRPSLSKISKTLFISLINNCFIADFINHFNYLHNNGYLFDQIKVIMVHHLFILFIESF